MVAENPRVESLKIRGLGRMAKEKVDVEVTNKEKCWLNGMEQIIKQNIWKRIPREVNVDDADPGANEY